MQDIKRYRDHIVSLIDQVMETQLPAIERAASLMAQAIMQGPFHLLRSGLRIRA